MSRRAWVRHVMGLPVSIHLRGEQVDTPELTAVVEHAFASIEHADRVFSTYRPESHVSRIRRGELRLEDAGSEVRHVAALCDRAAAITGGAFTDSLPGPDGARRFDPTGLVKGWAVERAADILRGLAAHAFCINAGGDVAVGGDLTGMAAAPGGAPWRIGVEDPRDRSTVAQVVELRQGAVATSGTAARGAHLFDPVTGAFPSRSGSVTVVGPSLLWADVWATALFVGSPSVDDRFVERAPDYRRIRL